MAVKDSFTWIGNDDTGWTEVTTAGGPITVELEKKVIQGQGVTVDQLGFYYSDATESATNDIWQMDMLFPLGVDSVVSYIDLRLSSGLGNATAYSIIFNSFPSPQIQFEDQASAIGNVSGMPPGYIYTAKFLINSDGTVSAYVDGGPHSNALIGTGTTNTFNGVDLYISAGQTEITPTTSRTYFDNFYVHSDGLSFDPPLVGLEAIKEDGINPLIKMGSS